MRINYELITGPCMNKWPSSSSLGKKIPLLVSYKVLDQAIAYSGGLPHSPVLIPLSIGALIHTPLCAFGVQSIAESRLHSLIARCFDYIDGFCSRPRLILALS